MSQIMAWKNFVLFVWAFLTKALLCSANTFGSFVDSSPFARNYVCQPIPDSLKLCRDMEYREMRVPNLLGHETMEEVKQQAGSWVPLLNKKCHKDLQLLLCSLFSPVCVENSPVPIYPCRSLCDSVKGACEPVMQKVGYPWPEMLTCSKFPQNDMCVNPQCESNCTVEPEVTPTICPPCDHELDSETILDLFCGIEFVLKVKIRSTKPSRKDLKLSTEKKKRTIYKQGSLRKKDLRRLTLLIRGGKSCTCPHLEPPSEKRGKKKRKKKDFYLVMGGKVGRKLFLSAIYRWPKRDKTLQRLSSQFTSNVCT